MLALFWCWIRFHNSTDSNWILPIVCHEDLVFCGVFTVMSWQCFYVLSADHYFIEQTVIASLWKRKMGNHIAILRQQPKLLSGKVSKPETQMQLQHWLLQLQATQYVTLSRVIIQLQHSPLRHMLRPISPALQWIPQLQQANTLKITYARPPRQPPSQSSSKNSPETTQHPADNDSDDEGDCYDIDSDGHGGE